MVEVIRSYSVADEHGYLSTFAPYPIVLGGTRRATSDFEEARAASLEELDGVTDRALTAESVDPLFG